MSEERGDDIGQDEGSCICGHGPRDHRLWEALSVPASVYDPAAAPDVNLCPFGAWTLLPLELRRRLRVLPVHQIGLMGVNDTRVPAHGMDTLTARLAHLADVPRCRLCRNEP